MNTTAATDRIWLKSYPPNTAAEIGPLQHSSVAALIEDSFKRYADRPAYTCMGKTITYSEMESMSSAIGAWLQSLGLQKGDRVAVMKDGAVVSTHQAGSVTEQDLFLAMGGEVVIEKAGNGVRQTTADSARPIAVKVPMTTVDGALAQIVAHKGEVIGLAGIAGQGQEQVLDRLWRRNADVEVSSALAYVPGDRQRSGILPIWDVARNLTITALPSLGRNGLREAEKETALVAEWVDRLKIRGGASAAITGLSGGNQQKVIVARAFASDADTILLDDPFRGVDVHTKAELYQLIKSEARKGRTIIWYSSENSEMQHCDRAYVLRADRIAGELRGSQITDERIISLSFAEAKESRS